jgi:hypothetical protein
MPVALALAHMAVGDLDGTFAWLRGALAGADLGERASAPRRSRADPRLQELLEKIPFKEAQISPTAASD